VQPLRMQPIFKQRAWGGRRLADLLGKDLPAETPVGESWELADHPDGRSRVADGPFAGKTLRWVLEHHGKEVIGQSELARGAAVRFPLMVRFVDVAGRLGLQVHPDDSMASARREGQSGKTKCWVVLHAEPGAWVVDGLKTGVTRETLAKAVRAGAVRDSLVLREVSAGDFIWLPAGRVHAAGQGLLLAEIAQNSDLTYSLYHWDDATPDGTPAGTNLADALEAIFGEGTAKPAGGSGRTTTETGLAVEHLVDCHAFSLTRVRIDRRPWAAETSGAYAVVVALAGEATLATDEAEMPLDAGKTVLVPAGAGEYVFKDAQAFACLIAAPPRKAPAR